MNTKSMMLVALISAVVGGVVGGLVVSMARSDVMTLTEITADRIIAKHISADEVVSKGDKEGVLCRMSKGGIQTSNQILAGSITAKRIVGQEVSVASNAVGDNNENRKVLVQLLADPASGGKVIVFNRDSVLVPGKPELNRGYALFMGFDNRALPAIFTQDMSKGAAGVSFVLRADVKPGAAAATETEQIEGEG